MISGEVLKYLKGELVVIYQKYGPAEKPSSLSDNANQTHEMETLDDPVLCLAV